MPNRYTLQEILKDKDFNEFLDGLMGCLEVIKITLADHVFEYNWDNCDLDLDVEIKGGRTSDKLSKFLERYKTVQGFYHDNAGTIEYAGHHGSKFVVIAEKYYLEISWGYKPHTVPYITLRERGLPKKKWIP